MADTVQAAALSSSSVPTELPHSLSQLLPQLDASLAAALPALTPLHLDALLTNLVCAVHALAAPPTAATATLLEKDGPLALVAAENEVENAASARATSPPPAPDALPVSDLGVDAGESAVVPAASALEGARARVDDLLHVLTVQGIQKPAATHVELAKEQQQRALDASARTAHRCSPCILVLYTRGFHLIREAVFGLSPNMTCAFGLSPNMTCAGPAQGTPH